MAVLDRHTIDMTTFWHNRTRIRGAAVLADCHLVYNQLGADVREGYTEEACLRYIAALYDGKPLGIENAKRDLFDTARAALSNDKARAEAWVENAHARITEVMEHFKGEQVEKS